MSQEIVPVDPTDVFVDMDPIFPDESPDSQFTRFLTFQEQDVWEPYDIEKLPETLLASGIQRLLRVANLVESEEPRIAYLCRFYTWEVAHRIDPSSSGRGVRQFKISFLQRLEKDEEFTMIRRRERNDIKELKRVYDAYTEYITRHVVVSNLDNSEREKLINAHRIASVLYEVLKAFDPSGAYTSAPESILLNPGDETGELLDVVDLIEETQKINLDNTFVHENTKLIVEKCKTLEEERQTHMSEGDDSVQSNHLTKTDIDTIYKEEVQTKKDIRFAYGSIEHDCKPSSVVPTWFDEDKYLETQERLNKVEKKIEEMNLKLIKNVEFLTKMMQNMFPDQVPPSTRANQTENNNNDKLSL